MVVGAVRGPTRNLRRLYPFDDRPGPHGPHHVGGRSRSGPARDRRSGPRGGRRGARRGRDGTGDGPGRTRLARSARALPAPRPGPTDPRRTARVRLERRLAGGTAGSRSGPPCLPVPDPDRTGPPAGRVERRTVRPARPLEGAGGRGRPDRPGRSLGQPGPPGETLSRAG